MSIQGTDYFQLPKKDPWKIYDQEDIIQYNTKRNSNVPLFRGHAWMTYSSLIGVFDITALAAHEARSGNWQRDMSQIILPLYDTSLRKLLPKYSGKGPDFLLNLVYNLLNIFHIDEFGMPLNSKEFGSYDPVEHMDNPAGESAKNVFKQVRKSAPGSETSFEDIDYPARGFKPCFDPGDVKNERPYLIYDERYEVSNKKSADIPINLFCSRPLQFDAEGMPLYIHTTKNWIKSRLMKAVRLSTQGNETEGYREIASAVHALQDYFFHSNSLEIAINNMLKERPITNNAAGGIAYLDTFVYPYHPTAPKNIDMSKNLKIGDRYAVSTGTFAQGDTINSIFGELIDKLKEIDPFKIERKPSGMMQACLDLAEIISKDELSKICNFLADIIGNKLDSEIGRFCLSRLNNLTDLAGSLANEAANLSQELLRVAGKILDTVPGFIMDIVDSVTDTLLSQKIDLENQLHKLDRQIEKIQDEINEISISARTFTDILKTSARKLRSSGGSASTIYSYLTPDPFLSIKKLAGKIPEIGDNIEAAITAVEIQIKNEIRRQFKPIYDEVVNEVITKIIPKFISASSDSSLNQRYFETDPTNGKPNFEAEKLRNQTSVSVDMKQIAKDRPVEIDPAKCNLAYWPPNHSQVGKDHPPYSELTNPSSHAADDHGNNWLHPIAEVMAMCATHDAVAVARKYWNKPRNTQNSLGFHRDVSACLDKWISHPATAQPDFDFWKLFLPIEFVPRRKKILQMNQAADPVTFKGDILKCTNDEQRILCLEKIYEHSLDYVGYMDFFNNQLRNKIR